MVLVAAEVVEGATRRLAAARAARAWARSSWSSLEPRNNGLVGDWRRLAVVPLCAVGLGLNGSTAIVVFSLSLCEREGNFEKVESERERSGYFPLGCEKWKMNE